MLCHATGKSETHFPIVYRYNLLMFFSPCSVYGTANKYEFWYTNITFNVILGEIGILVYKIHTYNIFKQV